MIQAILIAAVAAVLGGLRWAFQRVQRRRTISAVEGRLRQRYRGAR